MQRLFYLTQKELRQLVREKLYIRLIFIVPFVQIVIMGFAITSDVRNVPLAIVDEDHSAGSRRIVEAFSVTESFNYMGQVSSSQAAKKLMDDGKIKLALVIPVNFEKDLKSGRRPQVQALMDGVDGNSAGVALAYVNQIAMKLQREWLPEMSGVEINLNEVHITGIETRMWYNPSLESINNIVPGILAVLITMITSFLTGMSIVREKEIGTLEQIMVTPIKKFELIFGKVIPFVLVTFILLNLGIVGIGLIFGLWMKGNLFSLYLMSLVFSFSTLGLGVFASTIARTQQQAMFIAWFFMVFAMLLSGFFIPIENMPPVVQYITYLNPLRYFMVIIREIYLKGTEITYLWKQGLAMAVFSVAVFFLATVRFSKRLN